jgi:hypothetical protein
MRSIRYVGCLGLVLLAIGCGRGDPPMERDTVHKVTGKILIDGQPEPTVAVRLTRVGGPDASAGTSKMISPGGFTDNDGRFSIGTYEGGANGDGAPDGKYAITIHWGQVNLLGGRYEGDLFRGKYGDPDKSEFTVEVKGAPVEVPTIELSTKDLPQKEATPTLSGETEAGAEPEATRTSKTSKSKKD